MKPVDEFAELKALDPATDDIDPSSPRARATLERVLGSDPAYDVRPHRTRRRLVRGAVATAAVAIATLAVFVPRDSGPMPNGDMAFATWTAQPGGLSAKERADAVKACRKRSQGMGQDDQVNRAGTAIAERRGEWTLVILTGHDQFAATCWMSINSRNRLGGGFGNVDGPGRAAVGARELAPSLLGHIDIGFNGHVTSAVGRAGSDIVGLTYNSPTRGLVKASVQNGYFAFWVPGSEFDGSHPVPVRVMYRDGTSAAVKLSRGF
ncbi:hypothetical protein GCM10009789_43570 [Kribbella sancticallisti]|uniref:Uncharacterized protein n=1 Tax=Kribbella sancticallisti TaxID=460087 RepID=A0ABN2DUP2_9ACTN